MKSMPFLCILLACAGCMSQKKIDRALAELPPFMRRNIGPVKYEPLSPLSLFLAGQVIETDPSATIYLYAFADEDVLKHEAFHSFELLTMHNRPLEWQEYCLCMGNTETKITSHLAHLLPVPPQWLPSDSSATVYGETNHFEEGAEIFVHHQPEKKWDCVCRFAYGIPQNQSDFWQNITKRKPTADPTVLSIIRRNFHDLALAYERQKIAEKEPTSNPTMLTIIRRHFGDLALAYQRQKIAKEEPPADPTVFSTIRRNFLIQPLSDDKEKITDSEPPKDSTVLSTIRHYFND